MDTLEQIELRRQAIVDELLTIRALERGTLAEQKVEGRRKGQQEPVWYGPYYVLARWENGKTVSRRLTSPEQVERAQADIAAYKRFTALCREFEHLTHQLGCLEHERAPTEDVKKKPRRRSSRTRK